MSGLNGTLVQVVYNQEVISIPLLMASSSFIYSIKISIAIIMVFRNLHHNQIREAPFHHPHFL